MPIINYNLPQLTVIVNHGFLLITIDYIYSCWIQLNKPSFPCPRHLSKWIHLRCGSAWSNWSPNRSYTLVYPEKMRWVVEYFKSASKPIQSARKPGSLWQTGIISGLGSSSTGRLQTMSLCDCRVFVWVIMEYLCYSKVFVILAQFL